MLEMLLNVKVSIHRIFRTDLTVLIFRTTPEGNEIKDFNVSFSFIKNQIKKLVCKRQNLGDVNEWHPEINMCIN